MIVASIDNSIITVNNYRMVNVKKPFHYTLDRRICKASMEKLFVKPSSSINRTRYGVPLTEYHIAKMYAVNTRNLYTNGVYKLNMSNTTRSFQIKAMEYVMANIMTLVELENIKNYLYKVLLKITESYNFDCVVTDIPLVLENIGITLPIIDAKQWVLNEYKIQSNKYDLMLKETCKQYKVPLVTLDHKAFNYIDYSWITTSEVPYKNVLIIINTNYHYSGFLAKYLNESSSEVLPVTLFVPKILREQSERDYINGKLDI